MGEGTLVLSHGRGVIGKINNRWSIIDEFKRLTNYKIFNFTKKKKTIRYSNKSIDYLKVQINNNKKKTYNY